jgi:hypothetical protein
VRARVTEVLALEVDRPLVAEPLGAVKRGGAPDVCRLELLELEPEAGVVLDVVPALLELVEGRHERLGDVAAAVGAVEPLGDLDTHRAASTNARTFP